MNVSMNSSVNSSKNQSTSTCEGTENIHGYWINNGPSVLSTVDVQALKDSGVTDLFISTSKTDVEGTLVPFLNKFSGSGIRIHAWICCFKCDGDWYDPGTNPKLVDELMDSIIYIATNYDIDGIHLDSVRYPGTAYKHNGTVQVTSFVKNVYNAIQCINEQRAIDGKSQILLSAALMPECDTNGYYYGQDYSQLAPYLDFLVPMMYKGNYLVDKEWISTTTQYIVEAAGGKPVIAGIQTYRSDEYPVPISSSEINEDIAAAIDSGASGYVLFKYGLTDTTISGVPFYSNADLDDILITAANVKAYIEKYLKIPSNANLTSSLASTVNMPTLLYMLTKGLIYINSGNSDSSIRVIDYNNPSNPTSTVKSGSLTKSEYLTVASEILDYMKKYGCAPNYMATSLGNIPYQNLISAYSKIMNYYMVNKALPSTVPIQSLTAVSVSSTSPLNNAEEVTVTTPITITFNDKISAGSSYSGIIIKNMYTGVKLKITKTISGKTLTIKTPTRMFNKTYKIYIPSGAIKNSLGEELYKSYSFQFTTMPKESIPPTVKTNNPLNDATGVSLTSPITLTFSEKIVAGSNFSSIIIKNMSTGKKVSLASKVISDTILTIEFTYNRLSKNIYQVYIPAGAIKDLCNNPLAKYYTFNFKAA